MPKPKAKVRKLKVHKVEKLPEPAMHRVDMSLDVEAAELPPELVPQELEISDETPKHGWFVKWLTSIW